MSRGIGSSWWDFFSVHYFTLVLIFDAACCFSQVQTQTLCHSDERSALLQFKARFTINESASTYPFACAKVASWGRQETSDCCSWPGVECNEDTGHVVELDLASSCLYGSIDSNSSLFKLIHLQKLDLSDNHFNRSQIPARLGHDLTSLTYLSLSGSAFSGQIPSEISYLSKLSTLDLSFNFWPRLKLPSLRSLVQNLTSIEQLDLSTVDIGTVEPNSLMNASSLTSLILSGCDLQGPFPAGIFHLPNLRVLDLSDNGNLTGYFPDDLNRSSHLTKLDLGTTNCSGHLPSSIGNLRALNFLSIASCNFYPHVPSSLSNLTDLKSLRLSSFYDSSYDFSDQVLDSWSWFGKLTKLYHLGLRDTNLRGDLPCSLANLTQLSTLSLSHNQITGEVPCCLANLTQLSTLYLSENQITGEVPCCLANLTRLSTLYLNQNQITGEVPCCLANLTQLSELHLGHNQMSGEIPSCLGQLTQLTLLDLQFNQLQGEIPSSLFQLRKLEHLYLDSNNLSGSVEFHEFSKLKKLVSLRLSLNKLSVQIRTGFTDVPPELYLLGLGSCNLVEFPEFLKYTHLLDLDLSDNNLHGQIPKWLWDSSTSLWHLNLSHNQLTGFEENPVIIPWRTLMTLELDSNMLRGSLPFPPPSIYFYSVSSNEYAGEIPAAFCNAEELNILDLSNNNLNGTIPPCFENLKLLSILKLQNNSFHGDIPRIGSNTCTWLAAIDLSYNQLQGKLPRSIANCPQLTFLNLGNNQISDTFPSWLGKLQQLKVLSLRSNAFHGIIGKPASIHEFPFLSIVDLSSNDFSGMLPSGYLEIWNAMKSVNKTDQMYIHYATSIAVNVLTKGMTYDYPITVFSKGVDLKYFKTPYVLRLIDLSSNRFEGEIPGTIGKLRGLRLLNLSNNTLIGPIPSSLGNLTTLESLDLSLNQLSGKIPSDLAQLTFLAYFNVSHNLLYGPIPHGQQFDTFPEVMYQGNSGLCGKPLSKKCGDPDSTTPQTTFDQEEDSSFHIELDWFVVLPGAVAGLIVGVVGGNFWTDKKHDWFAETFSKRRQTRNRRPMKGFRR